MPQTSRNVSSEENWGVVVTQWGKDNSVVVVVINVYSIRKYLNALCQIIMESLLFWQLVPVTKREPCLEGTAVTHTQEVASASASSQDTTAICVGYETKLYCKIQILHLSTRVGSMCERMFWLVSTAATALGSVQWHGWLQTMWLRPGRGCRQ